MPSLHVPKLGTEASCAFALLGAARWQQEGRALSFKQKYLWQQPQPMERGNGFFVEKLALFFQV